MTEIQRWSLAVNGEKIKPGASNSGMYGDESGEWVRVMDIKKWLDDKDSYLPGYYAFHNALDEVRYALGELRGPRKDGL